MITSRLITSRSLLWLLIVAVWALLPASPAISQQSPSADIPVLLKADSVTFDKENGIVIATGHVELAQGERVLLADKVIYDRNTDTVTATGNVSLMEPTGEVMFAEKAVLSNKFKDGLITSFSLLMTDNSRLAAVGAKRVGGVITELRKAVFSPCKLCKDHPSRAPLWQIKGVRVIHDKTTKDIEYRDATLEMFGIPVLYMPFFFHPDPTVKRRSGFLSPSYGNSTDLGLTIKAPYYWNIAPDKDATLTPIYTSNEGPVFAGEYRQRLVNGEYQLSGSYTKSDDTGATSNGSRGHVRGTGNYDIDNVWRAGININRTTDDTYLRRYGFGSEPTLTTSGFVEGFRGRNYAKLSALSFQGLRATDDPGQTPLILPFAEYNFVGSPGIRGGRINFDASLLSLTRDEGTDSNRLSLRTGWHLPHTTPSGEIYDLSLTLQTDIYSADEVANAGEAPGTNFSGVTGRFFPQFMFKWRYPLIRQEEKFTQLIEPVAAIVLAPNGNNPAKIPNEDSRDVEFDDTNLFSPNRFTGVDRVEGGQRVIYGLKWGLYGAGGGATTAFLGQSFRFRTDSDFAFGSGLEDNLSDLVGKLQISPGPYLDFLYRFRFDPDNFRAARSEVTLAAGPPNLRLGINYLFVGEEAGTGEFGDREEISGNLFYRLNRNWSAAADIRQDLTADGGILSSSFGITYQDECFLINTAFRRSFTRDRDLEPSDTVFVQLVFKHLGEFQTQLEPTASDK